MHFPNTKNCLQHRLQQQQQNQQQMATTTATNRRRTTAPETSHSLNLWSVLAGALRTALSVLGSRTSEMPTGNCKHEREEVGK